MAFEIEWSCKSDFIAAATVCAKSEHGKCFLEVEGGNDSPWKGGLLE